MVLFNTKRISCLVLICNDYIYLILKYKQNFVFVYKIFIYKLNSSCIKIFSLYEQIEVFKT